MEKPRSMLDECGRGEKGRGVGGGGYVQLFLTLLFFVAFLLPLTKTEMGEQWNKTLYTECHLSAFVQVYCMIFLACSPPLPLAAGSLPSSSQQSDRGVV